MNGTKLIWQSKTFYVGLVTFVVGLLSVIVNDEWIAQYPQFVAIGATLLGVLNVVLRVMTETAVTFTKIERKQRPPGH